MGAKCGACHEHDGVTAVNPDAEPFAFYFWVKKAGAVRRHEGWFFECSSCFHARLRDKLGGRTVMGWMFTYYPDVAEKFYFKKRA